jgi:hypothetical protein
MNTMEKILTACPTGPAAQLLECCQQTIRNMGQRGDLRFTRTRTGRLLWNVREYLKRAGQPGSSLDD